MKFYWHRVHTCNLSIQEWRQQDGEFEASLDHVMKPYLKKKKKK
jgi:hypothetical protein